jgi:hypothetical protein
MRKPLLKLQRNLSLAFNLPSMTLLESLFVAIMSLSTQRMGTTHISPHFFFTQVMCPKPESPHAHKHIFVSFIVYLSSDLLAKPNPLNLTITITRRLQHQKPANDGRPPPYVALEVANRGVKFLYDLLLRLKESGQYPELNSLSKKQAVDGLKLGRESYIRRMWPFSDYTNDQDVLEWWRLVGKQPGGRVLSVGARSCIRTPVVDRTFSS